MTYCIPVTLPGGDRLYSTVDIDIAFLRGGYWLDLLSLE
jgi:hypothetical protein